jgi:hypothetical protein
VFGEVAGAVGPARRVTPNVARSTFLDGTTRRLFGDWTECARANVAYLRLEAGRNPQDRQLAALVDELSTRSVEFRRWWAEHPVADKTSGTKVLHHPVVGTLTMEYDTLRLAGDPDQALVTYSPRADGRSPEALRELLAITDGTSNPVSTLAEHVR